MRLGIDAREIQNGVYTGIGRPLANFLEYFASLENDDECVLFSYEYLPVDFGPRVRNVTVKKCATFLWDQISLPEAIRKERIDVFYSPYYKIPLVKPCRMVSAILDLMYLVFEPYSANMSLFAKMYYFTFGKAFAHRSDQILTCSMHSKKDIIRLYGVPADKITVIPLSVGDIYKVEQNFYIVEATKRFWNIKGRYLLYMGNFKLHKNVECIVEAFNYLAAKHPDLHLVLAGPKEHYYETLVKRVDELHLTDRVIFTGKISPEDQPHILYCGAEVFVMPTLYEGFGLPPAEAMACGVPVVSSNTTSVPEVVKDAGLLVDPLDVQAVADAIENILNNPGLRRELVTKGLHYVKEYDAQRISQQTYEFFVKQYEASQGSAQGNG